MRTLASILFVLTLLVAPAARAGIVLQTSVTDMTRLSSLVVRGEVLSSGAEKADTSRIQTRVRLRVAERLKGSLEGDTVDIVLPGGSLGELATRVPGTPRFTVGEEVVVFLEKRPHGFVVCGQEQGRFDIRRDTAAAAPQAVRKYSRGLSLVRPSDRSADPVAPKDDTRALATLRDTVRKAVLRHGAKAEALDKVFPR